MKNLLNLLLITILIFSCQNKPTQKIENEGNLTKIFKNGNPEIKNSKALKAYYKGLDAVIDHNYASAKNLFEEADRIEPNSIMILNAYAITLFDAKENEKAKATFQKTLSLDSTSITTYMNFGYFLNSINEYEYAIKLLKIGLSQAKNGLEKGSLMFNMAVSYYRINNCEEAIRIASISKSLLNSEEYNKKINDFVDEVKQRCGK
jgi:Tfp pilus assembly protein PilF